MSEPFTDPSAVDERIPAPEEHVEGGPACRWYKVRLSEEMFERLGTRVVWGEPDEEGFYTPTVYTTQAFDVVRR